MKRLLFLITVILFTTVQTSTAQEVLSSAHTVYFATGQSSINSKAKTTLDDLIARLKKAKEGTKYEVLVYGYADPTGGNELNLKLSINRINTVADYLVKMGIPEANVIRKIPRGEDLVRTKYFMGEKDLTNTERRQVELIVTPTINQLDPDGAPKE